MSGMMTEPIPTPLSEAAHFELPGMQWAQLPAHLAGRIGFASTWRTELAGTSVYGFNLGLHVGDSAEQVLARRQTLAAHYRIRPVWMKQVHGTDCAVVDESVMLQPGAATDPTADRTPVPTPPLLDCLTADAAFTQTPGVAPLIMTADCLPVLLVDEHGQAVAAVHCGWRGLLDGAIESTLSVFAQRRLDHDGLHAWLGPCIGADSFEVGTEVYEAFIRKNPAHASCFKPTRTKGAGKWLADLRSLAVQTLALHAQVSISVDMRDTLTDHGLNSFRRNPVTGRQASLIWIKTGNKQNA